MAHPKKAELDFAAGNLGFLTGLVENIPESDPLAQASFASLRDDVAAEVAALWAPSPAYQEGQTFKAHYGIYWYAKREAKALHPRWDVIGRWLTYRRALKRLKADFPDGFVVVSAAFIATGGTST